MSRYYITSLTEERGFIEEITENEWFALFGREEIRPYVSEVYREVVTLEEIPEEIRNEVEAVIETRIARFGPYKKQNISANEALNIIIGGK